MRIPRFRISWLMVFVAFFPVDFAAIRTYTTSNRFGQFIDLAIVGILPTLNILCLCVLVARFRPKNRPFLLGFVTFGASALTGYVICGLIFTNWLYENVGDAIEVISRLFSWGGRGSPTPILFVIASIVTVLPQLLVAWLGPIQAKPGE